MRVILFLAAALVAHFSFAQDSMNMVSLYNWTTDGMPSSSAWGNLYNEVWGYEQDGREYAIIGTTGGTHFIDVTDPANAVEVDFVEGTQTGPIVVHRDYHNMDNYLYMVCQEGQSSLQIADLSYLPDSVHVVYDDNAILRGSHNVFIDTAQAKLYACYVFKPGFQGVIGLQVIDISNPEVPTILDELYLQEDVHDMYVKDNIAYLHRGYNGGLQIVDFNESPPAMLGSITEYEGQGYNHSGYLSEDENIYVLADETHGSPLKILNVSDPTDIEVLTTVTSGINPLSIAHNQIIHDDKIYSAFYYDGIYVWSIENPESPVLIGYYDTSTLAHQQSYEGAWGVYPFLSSGHILVSDMQTGLWVLELDESLSADLEQKTRFDIFPNPTSSFITLMGENLENQPYQILDQTGRLVRSGYVELSGKIELSSMPNGIYILQIGNAYKRVIKN